MSGFRRRGSTVTSRSVLVDECRRDEFNSSNVVLRANCISKSSCGTQNIAINKGSSRIAGGTEAMPGSNPWLVALFLNGTFQCGGTIMDEQWVKISFSHQIVHSKPGFPDSGFELGKGLNRAQFFCGSVALALSKTSEKPICSKPIMKKTHIFRNLFLGVDSCSLFVSTKTAFFV